MNTTILRLAAFLSLLLLAACGEPAAPPAATDTAASAPMAPASPKETPAEFIADINRKLVDLNKEQAAAGWVRLTYITPDTAVIAAKAQERALEFQTESVKASRAFDGMSMDPSTARAMLLLKLGTANPAPDDPAKRAELAEITTRMEGEYGEGKYCPDGPDSCKTLNDLERIMADKKHDYDAELDAWIGWRTISPKMRKDYQRFVELTNEGAREIGFKDLGEMWRAGYDMSPADFEKETDRLWAQVEPLYSKLQCYVRDRLAAHYGEDKVPRSGPIPAHLLGNMWAQQWSEIYDLVEPYPGVADLDIDSALKAHYDAYLKEAKAAGKKGEEAEKWAADKNAREMVRMAEDFYTSLGMPSLPQTFWDRSMLLKPRDREVVCHASAWPMDGKEDVRVKMCMEPTAERLFTIFHELGHDYYFLEYKDQPPLFQGGAHDGFHEAIGDTVNLSMTPEYLHKLGLVKAQKRSYEATINEQMKLALDKIAFLPFGKLIDQWRWAVFDGRIKPGDYNAGWWELRTRYQGIAPPVARSEADFDPGAKYHIPGNTPYTRYFLSFIMQFQFHKALCEAAGYSGPLNECSVYGNKDAGARFEAMLRMGASRPWQDALEKLTGTREMDASAINEYFAPLSKWLDEKTQGMQCGW